MSIPRLKTFKKVLNQSITAVTKQMNRSRLAVSRALRKACGKSLHHTKQPLLTECQQGVCLECAKKLLNKVKNSLAGMVFIL